MEEKVKPEPCGLNKTHAARDFFLKGGLILWNSKVEGKVSRKKCWVMVDAT